MKIKTKHSVCTQSRTGHMTTDITTWLDLWAFITANNIYMASKMGYCPLYITFDHRENIEQIRAYVSDDSTSGGIPAMATQFISFSGSNQVNNMLLQWQLNSNTTASLST